MCVVSDGERFHAGQWVDGYVVDVFGTGGQKRAGRIYGYGVDAAVVGYIFAVAVWFERRLYGVLARLGVEENDLEVKIKTLKKC